jgi:hypothetical protein
MPCVEFEPTIPASEWAKTVHALDRSVTVTRWPRYMLTENSSSETQSCIQISSNWHSVTVCLHLLAFWPQQLVEPGHRTALEASYVMLTFLFYNQLVHLSLKHPEFTFSLMPTKPFFCRNDWSSGHLIPVYFITFQMRMLWIAQKIWSVFL